MQIITPHMSCVVSLPLRADEPNEFEQAMADGYAEIYVFTKDGIIKHHKLRGENRYIRVKVDSIPGITLPTLAPAINFLPAGKIPKELFDKIVAFFYEVMKKNGEKALEAMAHILWNREQGYHIGIPPQRISAASVSYDWSYLPTGTSIIVDIHSHNNMNAFFSGTDNNDDRSNISFSGVVGKMNASTGPETVWRFNYQERKFEAKIEDIFDFAPAAIEVPETWLDQIDVSTPRITYGGGAMGWPISTPGTQRGRADHLKDYQFRKKEERANENEVNGNRVGPGLRNSERSWNRQHELGDSLGSDYWDMGGLDGAWPNGYVPDRGAPAGASVASDPLSGMGRVGKAVGGAQKSPVGDNVDSDSVPPGSLDFGPDFAMHDRWDEISINHGQGVADAFCLIDQQMAVLSGEDRLLSDLIGDMYELGSDASKLAILRSLYERLSPRDQEALAQTGF